MNTSALDTLTAMVRDNGPIKTVRVSSAQARGAAKRYAYWGAVRYELRLTKAGTLSHVALNRAGSDRRSVRLAEEDADALAERIDALRCDLRPGPVDEGDAAAILALLGITA